MTDDFLAKSSFYISLLFWIPLFNMAISIVGLVLAFKAFKLIRKYPDKYGGFWYAIIAIILCLTSLLVTALGLVVYLTSSQICEAPVYNFFG